MDQLGYCRSPKTVPPPSLRYLPTTTPPAGVFVTHHPTAHQLKKSFVSPPLIPGRHVPTTSEIRHQKTRAAIFSAGPVERPR